MIWLIGSVFGPLFTFRFWKRASRDTALFWKQTACFWLTFHHPRRDRPARIWECKRCGIDGMYPPPPPPPHSANCTCTNCKSVMYWGGY